MTGDRPTTPGWHCHRCRSTSCRQRADSDTDHVGRVEYRPLLLTQPSSVSWLWSHTHWCPSQRPQEVMRVDGSANPTMPKNPAQYVFMFHGGLERRNKKTAGQSEPGGGKLRALLRRAGPHRQRGTRPPRAAHRRTPQSSRADGGRGRSPSGPARRPCV